MSKRVLMLSTTFPPDPMGRAERMRTRVKYLIRETEWEPVIVLPMGADRMEVDVAGESVPVYRAEIEAVTDGEADGGALDFVRAILNSPDELRKIYRDDSADEIIKTFKALFTPVPFPDAYTPYIPSVVRKLRRIIKRDDIDLLYTMCYPFSFHLSGRVVKALTGVPWIAEFRDPWVTNPRIFGGEAGTYNKKLERSVVRACDGLVYNYGIQVPKNYFQERYPEERGKVHRIECPGATGVDFERLPAQAEREDVFTITYGGSFYGEKHTPETFLKGLSKFVSATKWTSPPSVRFYGDWRSEFDDVVERLGLNDYVDSHEWVEPTTFFEKVKQSHAALYIVRPYEGDELNVPQKITDYVSTETPILALCSRDWEAAQFVRQNDVGIVADPDDPSDVARALTELYDCFQTKSLGEYTADPVVLERMDARQLSVEFGRLMDDVLGRSD